MTLFLSMSAFEVLFPPLYPPSTVTWVLLAQIAGPYSQIFSFSRSRTEWLKICVFNQVPDNAVASSPAPTLNIAALDMFK